MLNRTTSTPIWQRGLRAEINMALVHYLLFLVAICALACVYYWQASNLRQLQTHIVSLERQAARLERENMRLVQQSAQWNAPSYIQQRMREEGYVNAQLVIHTKLPTADTSVAGDPQTRVAVPAPGSQ